MAKGCGAHRKKYADGMVPPAEPSIGGFIKDRLAALMPGPTRLAPQTPSVAASTLQPVVNVVTDTGPTGSVVSAAEQRNAANRAALELAHGAVAIDGPGTGKSDSIHGVSLSKGESVLPAATTRALGARNIAKVIEATNGTAPKVGARIGGKHADGLVPKQEETFTPQQWAIAKSVYPNTTNPRESIENIRRDDPEKLQQLSRQLGGPIAAAPAPVAPVAPTPVAPAPAPVEPALGATRPTAPAPSAPAPKVGATGENYLRNEQTGKTYFFDSAPTAAPAPAPAAKPTGIEDRARAYAQSLARPGDPPEVYNTHFNQAMRNLPEADLRGAQTAEMQQKTELEQEEMSPTTTPERRAQIRAQRMSKTGDIWMPYQSKDSLGMPTGETLLYNRATGETRPMVATGTQAAPQRPVGTKSTVGGKTAVWDGTKWVPQ